MVYLVWFLVLVIIVGWYLKYAIRDPTAQRIHRALNRALEMVQWNQVILLILVLLILSSSILVVISGVCERNFCNLNLNLNPNPNPNSLYTSTGIIVTLYSVD